SASTIAVLSLGIGPGVHLVLRSDPALVLALEEGRHLFIHRGGAQDHGATRAIKDRALRGLVEADDHLDRTERIERATVLSPRFDGATITAGHAPLVARASRARSARRCGTACRRRRAARSGRSRRVIRRYAG